MRSTHGSFARAYSSVARGAIFSIPLLLVFYFSFIADEQFQYASSGAHLALTGLIIFIIAWVGYVTFQAYKKTRYLFLLIDVIGLFGFGCFEFFHIITTWNYPENVNLILFSTTFPLAVFAHYSLLALVHARNQSIATQPRQGTAKHVLFLGLLAIAFLFIVVAAPVAMRTVGLALGGFAAFVFLTISGVAIFGFQSSFEKWAYIFASYTIGFSAITTLFGHPWSQIWWLGHLFTITGLLLLGYLATFTYDKQHLLETTLIQRHHHESGRDVRAAVLGVTIAILFLIVGISAYQTL